MNAFLDDAELYTLTGYKRSADQIRFLDREGIPHRVNARGRPVVLRTLETPVAEPELGPVP